MQGVQPVLIQHNEIIASQRELPLDPLCELIGRIILCVIGIFTALTTLATCCICCCDEEGGEANAADRPGRRLNFDDIDVEEEIDEPPALGDKNLLRGLKQFDRAYNLSAGATHDVAQVALGKVTKEGITQAAATAIKNLEMNKKKFAAAPAPLLMQLQALVQERGFQPEVDPGELLTCFNTVFQNEKGDKIKTDRENLAKLIVIIRDRLDTNNRKPTDSDYGLTEVFNPETNQSEPKDMRKFWEAMYDEVYLCLPFLVEAFKDPTVNRLDKEEAMRSIANAGINCRPRLHEEFTSNLKKLRRIETVSLEELFLQRAEILKEDIIRASFPKMDPTHILNHARRLVGKEWGLEATETSKGDFHNKKALAAVKEKHLNSALSQNYTAGRFLEALRTFTSQIPTKYPEYQKVLNGYLQKHFRNEMNNFFETVPVIGAGRKRTVQILTYDALAKISTKMGFFQPKSSWW